MVDSAEYVALPVHGVAGQWRSPVPSLPETSAYAGADATDATPYSQALARRCGEFAPVDHILQQVHGELVAATDGMQRPVYEVMGTPPVLRLHNPAPSGITPPADTLQVGRGIVGCKSTVGKVQAALFDDSLDGAGAYAGAGAGDGAGAHAGAGAGAGAGAPASTHAGVGAGSGSAAGSAINAASVRLVALHGQGGIGKSTIAKLYARASLEAHSYPAGIMWLCGVSLPALMTSIRRIVLRHLATEHDIQAGISKDAACHRFFKWLDLQQERWLLVVDNVDCAAGGPTNVLAWLLERIQLNLNGHILVTTRVGRGKMERVYPGVRCVRMACLQPLQAALAMWLQIDAHNKAHGLACGWATTGDSAIDSVAAPDSLLLMQTHAPCEFKALVAIAEMLGCLPLALKCAAGALCAREEPFSVFLQALESHCMHDAVEDGDEAHVHHERHDPAGRRLTRANSSGTLDMLDDTEARRHIQAVWEMSKCHISDPARDLMCVLAHLPPDNTMEQVLVRADPNHGAILGMSHLQSRLEGKDVGQRRLRIKRLLTELDDASLIQRSTVPAKDVIPMYCLASQSTIKPTTMVSLVTIHRVVQDAVRHACGTCDVGGSAAAVAALSMSLSYSSNPSAVTSVGPWLQQPNLARLWVAAYHAATCIQWVSPSHLTHSLGTGGALEWWLARPAALARTLGQTCQLSDSLALCEVVLQAGEAHGLWVTARYTDSRADTGGDSSQALTQRRPSATAVASQRRIADGTSSLAYRPHWLVVGRRLPTSDGLPQVARALSDLAFVYRRLAVFRVAIKLQEEAASMLQAIHEGGQHPDLANSFSELGCCHFALGHLDEALLMHSGALKMRRKLASRGSVPTADVVSSMHRLAMVHMNMGATTMAEGLCRDALAMARADGHRESVAHCVYSLARVMVLNGRTTNAKAVFVEALELFRGIHEHMDHRDVAACQTSIAYIHSEYGEDVEAAANFTAAIAMYPDVAHAQRGLGLLYRRQGREAEAGELLASARAMDEAVLRPATMCDGPKSKPAIRSAPRATKNETRTRASVEPESKRTPTAGRALDDTHRGADVEHASGR